MASPKTYSIRSSNGLRGRYATQEEAVEALRLEMGWETISLTDWFVWDGGRACRAYESYDERDVALETADAPQIVESPS